jgi:hypothetical protein
MFRVGMYSRVSGLANFAKRSDRGQTTVSHQRSSLPTESLNSNLDRQGMQKVAQFPVEKSRFS